MSHSIKIQLYREKSHSVLLGIDIWDEILDFFAATYAPRKAFIVIDEKVHQLYGRRIEKQCRRYFQSCQTIQIPEGEKSKSIDRWKELQDKLLKAGVERSTPLLAVGGGVTGDLGGFAAASVLRGIPLVHLPTSLLAMVDSSIGGKTGVNHSAGKNLIGAFYQPDAVFADGTFLETLGRREWIGGLAEMLKYAAIQKPAMFDELEEAVGQGFAVSPLWMDLIRQCAAIKAEIVEQDAHEAGKRAFLNFGHTFGHALEKLAGYGRMSHGEAVFAGMITAVHYAKALGAPVEEARFSAFKPLYNMEMPQMNRVPDLIEAMRHDKKVKDGMIRLVLLNSWGKPYIEECKNESLLSEAWHTTLKEFNEKTESL
jgi:3-dehydroquinate synthase